MKRFRFSLLGLLVLIAAFAVFLGYSGARRTNISTECVWFQKQGVNITPPSDFIDRIWQRKPDTASIVVEGLPPSTKDFKRMRELEVALKTFGVSEVRIAVKN